MNAVTTQSEAAMRDAVAAFKALPVPRSEAATDAFIALVDAGYIRPEHMAALIYRMNNCLVDRYEAVALFMTPDLESVGDSLITAIECAERDEQDNIEEVAPGHC